METMSNDKKNDVKFCNDDSINKLCNTVLAGAIGNFGDMTLNQIFDLDNSEIHINNKAMSCTVFLDGVCLKITASKITTNKLDQSDEQSSSIVKHKRKRTPEETDELVDMNVDLKKSGVTYAEIAEKLDISSSYIYNKLSPKVRKKSKNLSE